MRPSQALAVAAFLALVPGAIWLAYAGAGAGLYPDPVVPLVFGVTVAVGLGVLAVALPRLRALEGATVAPEVDADRASDADRSGDGHGGGDGGGGSTNESESRNRTGNDDR